MLPRDPAKAVQVLDLMLGYFRGGQGWTRTVMYDPRGRRRCLLGMHRYVCRKHRVRGDGALDYLREALRVPATPWTNIEGPLGPARQARANEDFVAFFNTRCSDFAQVRELMRTGRAIAQAELPVRNEEGSEERRSA